MQVTAPDDDDDDDRADRSRGAGSGSARDERAPRFEEQGYTAEDRGGYGQGEQGLHASEYPGQNPLQSERERQRRLAYAWTWPRPDAEALGESGRGSESDRRICDAIGRRIEHAEPHLDRVVVEVLDGRVRLRGSVAEPGHDDVIAGLAGTVQGVRQVENLVTVGRRHR